MFNKKHILLFITLFSLACQIAFSATEYGIFDHYTTKDGLISNRVFSIDQDSSGFIWLGTDFGLDRFDGESFIHHRKNNYSSLDREGFLFIHALPNGRITGGGYYGFFVEYDPVKDIFRSVMPEEYNETFYKETMEVYIKNGKQYAYSSCGAYTYDPKTESYSSENHLFRATRNLFVRAMHIDQKKRYWLGSMDSMMVFSAAGKLQLRYKPEGDACSFVRTMLPLNDSLLLVASQTAEVWIFNTNQTEIQPPRVIKTPFDCITNIICDRQGRYWIATDAHGLWYTDDFLCADPQFTNLRPFNASIDDAQKIYCIKEDDKGDIWFGTQNSGLWRYKRENKSGITCSWEFGFPLVVCTSFAEDDQHNMIVSVDGGGLYKVDSKFIIKSLAKFPNNNISEIGKSKSGICYVASWGGGVYRCDLNTGAYEKEPFAGVNSPSTCFFGISVTNGQDIYACSSGDGLYHKKEGSSQWERIIPHDSATNNNNKWVLAVCNGRQNEHWILTTNSLWKEKNGVMTPYSQDVNTTKRTNPFSINDITTDEEGYLYAATSEGVARFSPDNKSPEILDFVPQSYYRAIVQDDNNNFWLAGDNGILYFNYEEKSCYKLPGNYTDVATFYFYLRSGYKAHDGKIYFGTNGGYISIDPDKLNFDTIIPYLSFSSLYINGKKVNVQEKPLNQKPLSQLSNIELNYGETNITIDVDMIDFSTIDRIKAQYRLIGLQNEWQPLPSDRKIKFSHLPSGSYTLEVNAYRSNENCEQKNITLTIKVLPPWWNSWWFRTLMVIALILLIIAIFRWRMRRLIEMKNELNEQVNIRTIELQNALKDKDSLISVIGHDLKNPMFAIVVALENWLLKEKALPEENKRKLIVDVHDSAKTLQGEMLKLLDWAQSKQDDLVCKPQDVDLNPLIDDIIQLTTGMIKRKNITCNKEVNLQHKAYVDPRMISAVIRNLLSNAVKFTETFGTITIGASENDTQISLYVQDSGVGMSEDALKRLSENQQVESTSGTDQEKGTGLGLRICKKYIQLNNGTFSATSKEGEGTRITITIPRSNSLAIFEKPNVAIIANREQETEEILSGNTLLMVDDNPLICENMKTLLSDFCNVLIAYDGKQALDIINENEVDIILSDVEMPIMNGIELCQQLQKDDIFSHIPILFLSGRSDENDRLLGLTNGAIDYIPKPFSQEELMAKLRSILKLRKQERAYLLAQLMQREASTEIDSEEGNTQQPKEDPFVNHFMDLIRERYSNAELSVDDLAVELCVSRSTMFRRIKTVVGKSPVELLSEYRLNEAMRQIKENNGSSINEIAYMVGFSDPSYFSKRFKSYFGISPTQTKK